MLPLISQSGIDALSAVVFLAVVGRVLKAETRTLLGAVVLVLTLQAAAAPPVPVLFAWGFFSIVVHFLGLVRG